MKLTFSYQLKVNMFYKLFCRWLDSKCGHLVSEAITLPMGPWWSSGQHARLLLRRSKFESSWSLQYLFKILCEKNEIKQKRGRVWPFLKLLCQLGHSQTFLRNFSLTNVSTDFCRNKKAQWRHKVGCSRSSRIASVTRLVDFLKFLVKKLLTKLAQIFGNF